MYLSVYAKKILPVRIYNYLVKKRNWVRCWLDFQSDFKRFWYYSHSKVGGGENVLRAELSAASHIVERSFSLPEPRSGFGKDKINSIFLMLEEFDRKGYDKTSLAYTNCMDVLRAYLEFHKEREFDLGDLGVKLNGILPETACLAGYYKTSKDEITRRAKADFREMSLSRYSIRSYGENSVAEEKIREAVEIARKTPSVCNRQSWKVYWIKSEQAKLDLLKLQNGHSGFGHQVDSFLIVTTDLCTFFEDGERNQSFVDGGLYSMSLMYSLHYVGLGACPLNWCMPVKKDQLLRDRLEIPESENIIMVIAIGSLPKEVNVANSVRKTVTDTLMYR